MTQPQNRTRPALREQLATLLDWSDAHVSFDAAVEDLPPGLRGVRPHGLPHSPWEIVVHIQSAQRDILDFCRAGEYRELRWPEEYWPEGAEPPSEAAWDATIAAYRRDRDTLQRMARDAELDLLRTVPHGEAQTYLREMLLVADHTAYHVGQLVLVRRLLGAWSDPK